MYDVMHLPGVIEIGKTGENLFRKIEFDLRPWLAEKPDGVGSIVHIRPGETGDDAYVAATTMENGILTWVLSAGDIGEVEGYGQMEVWLEDLTGARGKSARCQTFVRSSLAPTSETPPEAQEAWLEQMTGLKTETVIAAQSAEDAKEAAESAQSAAEAARDAAQAAAGDFQGLSATASGLAAGTSPTVNVTHDEGGLFNLAFGIPKGDKGDQGDPPTDSQVQTAANNYLSQVITNPDSPPLDRALSSNAAAAPADMVGDLKSALSNTDSSIKKILSPNLYNPDDPDILQNEYINPTGVIETVSGRTVTGFIRVVPGEILVMSVDNADIGWSSTCFYANDKQTVVSGGAYNTNHINVPTGAAYVRVTFSSAFSKVQIECNGNGTRTEYMPFGYLTFDNTFSSNLFPPSAKEVGEQLNSIRDITDNITEAKSSRNLYNPDDPDVLQNQYINPNGTIETVSHRTVTGFLPVIPGQKVVISRGVNGTRDDTISWASICFYNANKAVVNGGQYNTNKLSVPAGAAYARVTFSLDLADIQIECNISGEMTAYEPYFFPYDELNPDIKVNFDSVIGIDAIKNIPDSFSWRGNLSSGDIIRLPVTNVKNQQVYAFSGNISSFRKLRIGRIFQNSTTYGAFEIDSTNVIFYCDDGSTYTIPHGLTIVNNIQITLATENSIYITKAVLTSNGTQFDICANLENKRFLADEGAPFVQSDESTLTECSFSWTSRNISKPIWMFGDSYMSFYNVRWVYYLVTAGYDKACLINAYAGEASSAALASLQNLLTLQSKPKYILWAMGMNDGDTNGAVNASWKNCFDAVVALCENNGIIPILATIPNTPTIENSYKNAIVRNSGHRYIDFASSVGANTSGSGWYSGMLNSDNVHPDIPGAIALYNQALADFPELTVT